MELLVAQIVNGLSLGSIYILLVSGFNLLLLVAMIIHYSYPTVVVLSIYVAWVALAATGNSVPVAIVAAVAAGVLLNVITAPIFQRVMKNRGEVDINSTMIISMGIGMVITDVLSHSVNKGYPISFSGTPLADGGKPFLRFGLISASAGQALALGAGIVFVGLLFLLIYRSRVGRDFRAIAEDPNGAKLVGIPVLKTGLISYSITGLLGGLTAILMILLLGSASPDLGDQLARKVLAISIIAGLGNLQGGLVVGLALGILEAIIQGYLAGSWSNAIAFAVMLVVILVKPKGIFGSKL
jgi:branched-chain amino acid transport system permease protein